MNEYTSFRECVACKQVKPLSDFYMRPDKRNPTSECKDCMKARSKNRQPINRQVALVPSEAEVIIELHKQGIPALPGKALHQQWADVIAYGCVLIEVKSAKRHYRGCFQFGFTPSQRAGKLRGDLVVLVCKWDDNNTYHVFAANNPVFYGNNGKLKSAVAWTPGANQYKAKFVSMNDRMMEQAANNWDLVEQYLTRISARLAKGNQLPIRLHEAA